MLSMKSLENRATVKSLKYGFMKKEHVIRKYLLITVPCCISASDSS